MDLSGKDKNKITGKKYQPVMSITGLNDQGLNVKVSIFCWYQNVMHFLIVWCEYDTYPVIQNDSLNWGLTDD